MSRNGGRGRSKTFDDDQFEAFMKEVMSCCMM